MGKSRSPTYFRRLGRFLSLKGTKSSLVSIIYILKIINSYHDNVKHGNNCTDEWFYFLCGVITVRRIMLRHFTEKCVESTLTWHLRVGGASVLRKTRRTIFSLGVASGRYNIERHEEPIVYYVPGNEQTECERGGGGGGGGRARNIKTQDWRSM